MLLLLDAALRFSCYVKYTTGRGCKLPEEDCIAVFWMKGVNRLRKDSLELSTGFLQCEESEDLEGLLARIEAHV